MEELNLLIEEVKTKAIELNGMGRNFKGYEYFGKTQIDYKELLINYNCIQKNWIQLIREGKKIDVEIFKKKLNSEIDILKAGHDFYPSRTNSGISILGIFYQFFTQLKYIEFEIELISHNHKRSECDCALRLKYSIEPKIECLKHVNYGLDLYEKYKIYCCKECHTNWIYYNSEVQITDMKWKEWNDKEFPLEKK